jgi:hypothetical protein
LEDNCANPVVGIHQQTGCDGAVRYTPYADPGWVHIGPFSYKVKAASRRSY